MHNQIFRHPVAAAGSWKRNRHVEREVRCCYAPDLCWRLMGFHTHPHLRGGSLCFLTVSVTSCERSLGMALPDTWTIPVSYVCMWRRVMGRKTPWRSRRQWKERLRNMSEQKAAATWGWLQGEHSFILTVNLNLDEVQCIPRLCFKTKAKYLSFQLGWNTGRQKKNA